MFSPKSSQNCLNDQAFISCFTPYKRIFKITIRDEKKRLKDLPQAEIKEELKKRGLLPCNGSLKAVLQERLRRSLVRDGHDPEEFTFRYVSNTMDSPAVKQEISFI